MQISSTLAEQISLINFYHLLNTQIRFGTEYPYANRKLATVKNKFAQKYSIRTIYPYF